MAKYGEGDKRWIVEDRPDGTNVHNWHWAETDCLEWSRSHLSNLLSDLPILSGEDNLHIRTKTVEKIDGEAYVNIRKGKIIPGYELSVSIPWQGEAKDDHGASLLKIDGEIEIPYLADENAGEDPEIRVSVNDDGPIGKRLKETMSTRGKSLILDRVRVYVEAMAKGGPCKDDLKAAPVKEVNKAVSSAAAVKRKEEAKERKGFKTIKVTEKLRCRAADLYEILMDENRWRGFTQSNAKISKEVGGEFSIFDGSVSGTNVELKEGKLIVQKWRFGSWPDGVYSTVRLTFEEPEPGVTVIKLIQTDVPEEDRYGNDTVVENTERGWRDLIFHMYDLGFSRDHRLDLKYAQTDHKQNTTGFLRGSGKPYSTGPQEGRSVPKSTRQSSAQNKVTNGSNTQARYRFPKQKERDAQKQSKKEKSKREEDQI